MDGRSGGGDIYMYDLKTNQEIQIYNARNIQALPSIYDNKIVWQDYRNGNWDIYLYTNEFVNVPSNENENDSKFNDYYFFMTMGIVIFIAGVSPFIYFRYKHRKQEKKFEDEKQK